MYVQAKHATVRQRTLRSMETSVFRTKLIKWRIILTTGGHLRHGHVLGVCHEAKHWEYGKAAVKARCAVDDRDHYRVSEHVVSIMSMKDSALHRNKQHFGSTLQRFDIHRGKLTAASTKLACVLAGKCASCLWAACAFYNRLHWNALRYRCTRRPYLRQLFLNGL